MDRTGKWSADELRAVLIAPNRELAERFLKTLPETRAFQIVADLKKYPLVQTLEIRLRQLRPEVLFMDVSADVETAAELVRFAASFRPSVQVIALHHSDDSGLMLRILQLGACEFFFAPFDAAVQREAATGILRRQRPEKGAARAAHLGKAFCWTSVKPGSGASIVACQTALALAKSTGQRVLLADFDATGGTAGFYLRLGHAHSVLDALEQSGRADTAMWPSLVSQTGGVDVLAAPSAPRDLSPEPERLRQVLDLARREYDFILVDLPAVFHRVSLLALAESDRAFLVATPELQSLHLARKAIQFLGRLGIGKERYRVLINRTGRGGGVRGSDLERVLNCSVECTFPEDPPALHRLAALGGLIGRESPLGRAIGGFAASLGGAPACERRSVGSVRDVSPALAAT